jgi:SulP family sulfate permease
LERYGLANLIIATAMSGVILFVMGLLRFGTLIRFIPVAVVIGFTNGIAVLIALSQLKDFLGLDIATMPADFFSILRTLSDNLHTLNPQAFGLALGCLVFLVAWQFVMPSFSAQHPRAKKLSVIPGSILVLVLASVISAVFGLQVETIASRFGGIPSGLPTFEWPTFSWETAKFLLIPALTLALLGSIESLLCARVADQMMADTEYGDRHDANQELMAQGIANLVTPFFGGMPATGTIARTVRGPARTTSTRSTPTARSTAGRTPTRPSPRRARTATRACRSRTASTAVARSGSCIWRSQCGRTACKCCTSSFTRATTTTCPSLRSTS